MTFVETTQRGDLETEDILVRELVLGRRGIQELALVGAGGFNPNS
jgi:hypothetical protein